MASPLCLGQQELVGGHTKNDGKFGTDSRENDVENEGIKVHSGAIQSTPCCGERQSAPFIQIECNKIEYFYRVEIFNLNAFKLNVVEYNTFKLNAYQLTMNF